MKIKHVFEKRKMKTRARSGRAGKMRREIDLIGSETHVLPNSSVLLANLFYPCGVC